MFIIVRMLSHHKGTFSFYVLLIVFYADFLRRCYKTLRLMLKPSSVEKENKTVHEFHQNFSSINPSIVTINCGTSGHKEQGLPFLDTITTWSGTQIEVNVYRSQQIQTVILSSTLTIYWLRGTSLCPRHVGKDWPHLETGRDQSCLQTFEDCEQFVSTSKGTE